MSDGPCVDGCGQDAATIERLRLEVDDWRRECERWRDEAGVDGPFDALVAERDEIAGRLSHLLCDLTGSRLSKTGYSVQTMVQEIEEYLTADLEAENERLREQLAAVEALADKWEERCEHYRGTGNFRAQRSATDELRAAIAPQNHPRSAADAPEAPGQHGRREDAAQGDSEVVDLLAGLQQSIEDTKARRLGR